MDDLDLNKIAAAVERGETFGPQTMRQLIALARRDGGWSRVAELAAQIAEQWDNKAFIWSATDDLRALAALRQPDTAATDDLTKMADEMREIGNRHDAKVAKIAGKTKPDTAGEAEKRGYKRGWSDREADILERAESMGLPSTADPRPDPLEALREAREFIKGRLEWHELIADMARDDARERSRRKERDAEASALNRHALHFGQAELCRQALAKINEAMGEAG